MNEIVQRIGHILEVDQSSSTQQKLHNSHSDYPLAPEKMKATQDVLSPYWQNAPPELVPNLQDTVSGSTFSLPQITNCTSPLDWNWSRSITPLTFSNVSGSSPGCQALLQPSQERVWERFFFKLMNTNECFLSKCITTYHITNRIYLHKLLERGLPTQQKFSVTSNNIYTLLLQHQLSLNNSPLMLSFEKQTTGKCSPYTSNINL